MEVYSWVTICVCVRVIYRWYGHHRKECRDGVIEVVDESDARSAREVLPNVRKQQQTGYK